MTARPTVRGIAARTTRRLRVKGKFLGLKRSFSFCLRAISFHGKDCCFACQVFMDGLTLRGILDILQRRKPKSLLRGVSMIKKILLIVASLVFGMGVLTASAYKNSEKALAQKIGTEGREVEVIEVEEGDLAEIEKETGQEKVDYVLPYPGMLPDNKFYFLKMLRDKIWGFLIFDEVKKIDWLILMGDKRLAAGKVLIDTGKTNLGVAAIIKGEGYIAKAVSRAEVAKERNLNVHDQLEKLRKSLLKHKEILMEMVGKTGGGERGSLERLIEPLGERISKIKELLGIKEQEVEEELPVEEVEEEGLTTEFGEE